MSDHVATLEAIRSAFDGIPKPCAERAALDAAIAALRTPQPVTPAGGEFWGIFAPSGFLEKHAFSEEHALKTAATFGEGWTVAPLYRHPPVADAALAEVIAAAREVMVHASVSARTKQVARLTRAIAALNQRGGGCG